MSPLLARLCNDGKVEQTYMTMSTEQVSWKATRAYSRQRKSILDKEGSDRDAVWTG
jgi:hypothetical protein